MVTAASAAGSGSCSWVHAGAICEETLFISALEGPSAKNAVNWSMAAGRVVVLVEQDQTEIQMTPIEIGPVAHGLLL